ncbi:MAG: endonuclease/exonuclease/phosphatase family protein [Gammaproteobacteria bacterium]
MNRMRTLSCAWLAIALLATALPAPAREECPFLRDPAYHARTPLPPAAAGELAIGTLNAFRLFDDEQDGHEKTVLRRADFVARIERMARYIARDMGAPAVLGLQELEDDTALAALAAALERETGRRYTYLLGEKTRDGDIHSGLLLDARLQLLRSESLFAAKPFDRGPRFDRLPLVAEVDAGAAWPGIGRLTLVVVHLKSQSGMQRPDDAECVREKRRAQAGRLAEWAREQGAAPLVVLGDFNAPAQDPDPVRAEPMRILLDEGALVDVAGRFLQPGQRWTYRYRCSLQQLDHVLLGPVLVRKVRGYAIARGDTCIRAREKCSAEKSVSDHEGVVLRLGR